MVVALITNFVTRLVATEGPDAERVTLLGGTVDEDHAISEELGAKSPEERLNPTLTCTVRLTPTLTRSVSTGLLLLSIKRALTHTRGLPELLQSVF